MHSSAYSSACEALSEAGRGIHFAIENAIARDAGVYNKCDINLSSTLEEVDVAFIYGARRQMAFSYIHDLSPSCKL